MQNLVSRIAGVNNEELANRGIGMAGAMAYSIKTIAYQFKGNDTQNNSNNTSFLGRMVSNDVNTDNSQITPISTTKMETNKMQTTPMNTSKINESKKNDGKDNIIQNDKGSTNHNIMNAGKKVFNTGKEFMNMGMYMAEGRNFRTNTQEQNQRRIYNRPNINNTRKEDTKEEESKTITVEVDDADE